MVDVLQAGGHNREREELRMRGGPILSALAARASAWEPADQEADVASVETFEQADAAVAAALLLMRTSGPAHGAPALRVVIATADADAAPTEARALVACAPPGSVLLTASSVEALGRRLPDGMAIRAETLEVDGRVVTAFALRAAGEVVPHVLPFPPTRFIGRASQLRAIRDLLREERLVTLTGPPGSGKTRLAIAVARAALGEYRDGAWFVRLARITDADLGAAAVAETLSLKEAPDTPLAQLVADHLADKELLLVVDNFEHVLDAAPVLGDWLAAAPALRVLATSREALHLSGEHEFAVPPLSVPADPDDSAAAKSEAVQLFVERMRALDPAFAPDASTLPLIARICRQLDE